MTKTFAFISFIALIFFLYTVPFISQAQFIRATEADRALIAYEMLQRKDFVLEYLLNKPYPTKPPLFYWLIASSYVLFNQVSEFSARFPSAFFSSLLLFLFFSFLRRNLKNTFFAFFAAAVLASFPQFFKYSVVAEIDMV
ncbi:MAG: phospholipid carrier-dependent glycosyltransferase, partial [Candidatus Dadabacteria bacterium]